LNKIGCVKPAYFRRLFFFLLLISFCSYGCLAQESKPGATTVITATDNSSQVTVPETWKVDNELHDTAELQASNRAGEEYLIVLSESKEDFQNMTLEKHSETTRTTFLKSLTEPTVSEPTTLTINGLPALQYEIHGSINNLNVIYLHTTIESPKNFHQLIAWTLRSRFQKNKPELQQVINSFKERP
jgi:hypothetical protein